MTPTTHVIHGHSYSDLLVHKGKTRKEVADILGIDAKVFNAVMSKKDLGHLFGTVKAPTNIFIKTRKNGTVMMASVPEHYGKPAEEAALALGITKEQLRRGCHTNKLYDKFVWPYATIGGTVAPVSHPNDIDLVPHDVVCTICKKGFKKHLWPGVKPHRIIICEQCD